MIVGPEVYMIGHYSKNLKSGEKTKKNSMNIALLPYKIIGDAAYPMRPWFYSPFKRENACLSREKT